MKRLLAAAATALCLGLSHQAHADMAQADGLYDAGRYDEAFAAYAELAREEDGQAMLRMARMFEAGEGVRASRTQALTWYRRAGAHDVAEAHFRIGEMYETGIGVPRDYAAAVRAYRAAADLGDVPALIRLANLYVDGSGAMPDTSEAARLLKQAADSGDPDAVAALDRLVASGVVPRNVLDDLGIPAPPPPTLPTIEELTAGIGEEAPDATQPQEDHNVAAMAESEAAAQVRAALGAALSGFSENEEGRLEYTIDIAEEADGAMVATIRSLRLVAPDATWEIGDLVYAMTPDSQGIYGVVMSVPEVTTFFDADGMAVGGTTVASQDIRGTWNVDLNLWTQGTFALHDIALEFTPPDEDPFAVTIGQIAGDGGMSETAPGKWSGPSRIALESIVFGGDRGEAGRIARIDIGIEQRAVDYLFFQAMGLARAEFEGRFGVHPSADDPAVQQALQEITRPLIAMARERAPLLGDVGMDFALQGLSGTDSESGTPFSLESLHIAMSAHDLDAQKGIVRIALEHSGFAMAIDGATQRYLPSDGAFVIAFRDLPIEDSATMALEMFEGGLDDPAAFQDNAMMALTFLGLGMQQSMAATGTTLEIENISYVSQALKASMAGALVATTASPLGATGTVTLEVEGLDEALAEIAASKNDPDAQDMAMPLSMLQAMGERVEEGGSVRHVYVMELTPDGRTLLNGNDMGPMMEGLMGGGGETYQ